MKNLLTHPFFLALCCLAKAGPLDQPDFQALSLAYAEAPSFLMMEPIFGPVDEVVTEQTHRKTWTYRPDGRPEKIEEIVDRSVHQTRHSRQAYTYQEDAVEIEGFESWNRSDWDLVSRTRIEFARDGRAAEFYSYFESGERYLRARLVHLPDVRRIEEWVIERKKDTLALTNIVQLDEQGFPVQVTQLRNHRGVPMREVHLISRDAKGRILDVRRTEPPQEPHEFIELRDFDAHGNWLERVWYYELEKFGKMVRESWGDDRRTISYRP